MIIQFQGKNRNLKMTYFSIHLLELAFSQPYANFIMEQTPFNQSLYCFWAMIQNDKEFEGLSVPQIADLLDESLEKEEFTLQEYFDKVNKSYSDSLIVQQLFKKSGSENPSGRGEGNSPTRGKVLHAIMRRLRNFAKRFLEKHPE